MQLKTLNSLLLSPAVLVVVLMLLVSCGDDDSPVRASSPQLGLEIVLDPVELRMGDWAALRFHFSTIGNDPVELNFTSSCQIGYKVLHDGKVIMSYPVNCGGDSVNLIFRETFSTSITTSIPTLKSDMENVMEYGAWLSEETSLQPGEYVVHAGLVGHEDSEPWVSSTFIVLP